MELLSTQVVSDLLAALKPQEVAVVALASVRDHRFTGLPPVASSWQELVRTHGTAPGSCTARPRTSVSWMIFQEPEPTGGLSAAAGCCTVEIGALCVSGVDVAFKQIGSDDRTFL